MMDGQTEAGFVQQSNNAPSAVPFALLHERIKLRLSASRKLNLCTEQYDKAKNKSGKTVISVMPKLLTYSRITL